MGSSYFGKLPYHVSVLPSAKAPCLVFGTQGLYAAAGCWQASTGSNSAASFLAEADKFIDQNICSYVSRLG